MFNAFVASPSTLSSESHGTISTLKTLFFLSFLMDPHMKRQVVLSSEILTTIRASKHFLFFVKARIWKLGVFEQDVMLLIFVFLQVCGRNTSETGHWTTWKRTEKHSVVLGNMLITL